MSNISLLENGTLIQTPFIKVQIGDHTFGVYNKKSTIKRQNNSVYVEQSVQYPNYIQSLQIAKINGQVNTYTLVLKYAITPANDPNFFEKVFSQVSQTRKIIFSYGDLNAPTFLYKNEEAIITDVQSNFDINSAVIQYNVTAVSSSKLATAGAHYFKERLAKPSDIIKELLRNNSKYGLQDIFPGMRDMNLVEQRGLIESDDIVVKIDAQYNMSVLEYLRFLVSNMIKGQQGNKGVYVFKVIDDTTGDFNGTYFKVVSTDTASDSLDTFNLDIGFPSNTVVTSFTVNNNQAYSILYDYSKDLNVNEYIERIDDNGEITEIYSPLIGSANAKGIMEPEDQNWWKNVTEFPISAQIRLKGLLRPAMLMSKVRLKVYFYGRLHTSSGLYIINKQVDDVGIDGYFTTLDLIRVAGDNSIV